MKLFLSLCVLVATAVAHPTSCPPCENPCPSPCPSSNPPPCESPCPSPCDLSCESSSSSTIISSSSSSRSVTITTEATFITDKSIYPPYIPPSWNIVTFDSVCATHAFEGVWYVTMTSPFACLDGQIPLHTGMFFNGFPTCNERICFADTTPDVPSDFNTDFYMLDTSFNLVTQKIEKTRALLKAAYGSGSTLAVFNVCTEGYYQNPIEDLEDLIDENLRKHPCDDFYKREYTMACIGADKDWNKYLVFVIVNQYEGLFCGNDHHYIIVLTRECSPPWSVYEQAFNDIKGSGLSPYYLISMDQSIDLKIVSSLTPEDIDCVIDASLFTMTTTKSVTCETTVNDSDACDGSDDSDDSDDGNSSTTVKSTSTTVSTVDFVLKPDYICPYEIDVYEDCGNIKILKNLTPLIIREILSGTWYLQSATPCLLAESDNPKFGLLNNAFPCLSLQLDFEDVSTCPWDYITGIMMAERSINALTGEVTIVKSIIGPAVDENCQFPAFVVYTEGCYQQVIPKVTTINTEGFVFQCPGSIYIDSYTVYIAGYKPDAYMLLYIPSLYKNLFCEKEDKGLFYVFTRSRVISLDLVDEINQQILLCGFNPRQLVSIDQYLKINESFVFESSQFQYSHTSSSTVTVETSSSTVTSAC